MGWYKYVLIGVIYGGELLNFVVRIEGMIWGFCFIVQVYLFVE